MKDCNTLQALSSEERARQERTFTREAVLQNAVVAYFPQGDKPIRLVSSNGQECSVRFLHKQDGFYVDLPDEEKATWHGRVHRWLLANPGATLVQDSIVVRL